MSVDRTQLKTFQRLRWLEEEVERLSALDASSIQNVTQALLTSIAYLTTYKGTRAVWANYNANFFPSGLFGLSPISNPVAKYDATRYPYWFADQSAGDYMTENGNAFWAVDAGVHSWNQTPGVTVGCWVRHTDHTVTNSQGVLAAWNANASSRIWRLQNIATPTVVGGNDRPRFDVSNLGTDTAGVIELAVTPSEDVWVLYVGRWTPSTETKVWLFEGDTNTNDTNTTSIPGTLYRPSAGSTYGYLGAFLNSGGTAEIFEGDIGLSFLIMDAVPDAQVEYIHGLTRHIYGV